MNPGAILIGVAILILSAAYVTNPFFHKRKNKPARPDLQDNGVAILHKNSLAAIRDLDFDFQIGKITQEDYEPLRAQLVLEVADYLQKKQEQDQKVEELIRARQSKKQFYCPHCGKHIQEKDLFCTGCGMSLTTQG